MLSVYLFITQPIYTIDLSRVPSNQLADECDNILAHHTDCKLFFGFLEPGFMLDPKHEARIRKCIRKFECHLICFHLESIPFSWKNEIDTVYCKSSQNGHSEIVNDGCPVQHELQTEHRRSIEPTTFG
jgi:hypothetical protein